MLKCQTSEYKHLPHSNNTIIAFVFTNYDDGQYNTHSASRRAGDRECPGAAGTIFGVRFHPGPSAALFAGNASGGFPRYGLRGAFDLLVGRVDGSCPATHASSSGRPATRPGADLCRLPAPAAVAGSAADGARLRARTTTDAPLPAHDWHLPFRGGRAYLKPWQPVGLPEDVSRKGREGRKAFTTDTFVVHPTVPSGGTLALRGA